MCPSEYMTNFGQISGAYRENYKFAAKCASILVFRRKRDMVN